MTAEQYDSLSLSAEDWSGFEHVLRDCWLPEKSAPQITYKIAQE